MFTRIAPLLSVGLAALALGACGDDDDKGSESSSAQTMDVTLGADGKLTGVKPLEAGTVTVNFTNKSKQPHDLQLVRVDGNRSAAQVLDVTAGEGNTGIPPWLHGTGGPPTTRPNQTGTSTQALDGGRYYALAEPDGEGKPITAGFQVSGGAASGTLPEADATIDAKEYTFTTEGLKTGKQKIEFTNSGKELHHAIFVPLKPGATLAQAKQFFATEKGPPPFDESRQGPSTTVLDGGKSQVADVQLDAGKYALVCFIPDRKGGPPHFAKGMITEVDVS